MKALILIVALLWPLGRPSIPPCDVGWTVMYIPEFGDPLLITLNRGVILDQSITGRVCIAPERDMACFTLIVHQPGISTTIHRHEQCGVSLPVVIAP